jgi:DNA-directed RNA polymerase subunit RPC12/RpoP
MVYQVPQKWIFACGECGCIFTINAKQQKNNCPVCKSNAMTQIKGFDYHN